MNCFADVPVLVLGLGASGLAMARWCARHGAQVSWWDSRETPPGAAALLAEFPLSRRLPSLPAAAGGNGEDGEDGEGGAAFLGGLRWVLKSPGLAPHDPRIAPLLQAVRDAGIPVQGELDLFARALHDLRADHGYEPRVLAVTGTNGKTTTTAMTALLVERTGQRVATAGNIGPTLLDTLAEQLQKPAEQWPQVWVLELSSFQLEGGGFGLARGEHAFEPTAAAVLNVTQDHLDWHGGMAAYAAAKARAFGSRAVMVVNRDDPLVDAMAAPPPAAPAPGKGKPRQPAAPERDVVRFGTGAPRRVGDFGIVDEAGIAWLVRALPRDDAPRRRKSDKDADRQADAEVVLQRLMPADALRVRGRHNAANALAALALATAIGCPLAPMLHGLRDYRGEPHRVQPVGIVGGVEAYDDSKGTNVGATVAALEGLGADKAPGKLAVILGGDGKGQDFSPLAQPLLRHARAVATVGRDAAAIEAVLRADVPPSYPVERHATLEAAVAWSFAQARSGDAVLLSPACASLDMFRDYAHRADVFVQAVQALAADAGEVTA